MERSLDRSVVSESILKSIDLNKLPNPAFELITSEWKMPDSADSTVPVKRGLESYIENEEPPLQKPKLCLSLKKGANCRFSKPISVEERKKADEPYCV